MQAIRGFRVFVLCRDVVMRWGVRADPGANGFDVRWRWIGDDDAALAVPD